MTRRRARGCAVVALVLITACGFEHPTLVAVVPIGVSGRTLYVKRQVWGFNGDQTVISWSADWRTMPSPGDRQWRQLGPPTLLYRVEGDQLHLWERSPSHWEVVPGGASLPVVVHAVNVVDRAKLEEEASALGITRIGPHDWPLRKP